MVPKQVTSSKSKSVQVVVRRLPSAQTTFVVLASPVKNVVMAKSFRSVMRLAPSGIRSMSVKRVRIAFVVPSRLSACVTATTAVPNQAIIDAVGQRDSGVTKTPRAAHIGERVPFNVKTQHLSATMDNVVFVNLDKNVVMGSLSSRVRVIAAAGRRVNFAFHRRIVGI